MQDFPATRKAALAAGSAFYFTGIACKNGHVAKRSAKWRVCYECNLVGMGKYMSANREKNAESCRKYHAMNSDKVAERNAEWRKKNAAELALRYKVYCADNPHLVVTKAQHRRAAKLHAMPAWFGEFDRFALAEAASLAALRKRATGFVWHVDHMYPLRSPKVCGLHIAGNFQVIPGVMNMSKGNRFRLVERGDWLRSL